MGEGRSGGRERNGEKFIAQWKQLKNSKSSIFPISTNGDSVPPDSEAKNRSLTSPHLMCNLSSDPQIYLPHSLYLWDKSRILFLLNFLLWALCEPGLSSPLCLLQYTHNWFPCFHPWLPSHYFSAKHCHVKQKNGVKGRILLKQKSALVSLCLKPPSEY